MYKRLERAERVVDPAIEERLGRIDAATLSDTMGRHGAMSHRMRPLVLGRKLVGPALTVLCPRGDNLMVHKALQMARPGDVLVIDTGETYDATVMGRNMSLFAQRVGIRGAVIDGTVRDRSALVGLDFSIFCIGVTPRSAVKHGVGAVDVPVACGGVVVQPGDIVVADDDGVVVVPHQIAAEAAEAAEARLVMEDQQAKDVLDDDLPLEILYGGDWVEERLRANDREQFQIRRVPNPTEER